MIINEISQEPIVDLHLAFEHLILIFETLNNGNETVDRWWQRALNIHSILVCQKFSISF